MHTWLLAQHEDASDSNIGWPTLVQDVTSSLRNDDQTYIAASEGRAFSFIPKTKGPVSL